MRPSRATWRTNTARTIASAPGRAEPGDTAASLGSSAELFATVFRDAPDAILIIDAESGRIVESNRAVRHHLGFEPSWLIGRHFDALNPNARWRASVAERVRLHGALLEDQELRRIDGSRCAMQVRAWLARWQRAAVVIVMLRDVRERQRAEAGRRHAEARYRSIFENAVEGIFQTTPDGRYLAANPALARIYGYGSPDELMARLTDIAGQLYVEPGRRAQFRRLLERHDVVRNFESRVHRHDGSDTWISENARAVRDAGGALLYYEGTVIDISERKRAEAAQRTEAQVAGALAQAGEAFIASLDSARLVERLCQLTTELLESDSSMALQWMVADDAYVRVASARRRRGRTPPMPAIRREALAALLARLDEAPALIVDAAAGSALPRELFGARPSGGTALCFTIRSGGLDAGVLMVARRRRTSAFTPAHVRIGRGIGHLAALALEHARVLEELGRANRLKSEFVATMSHELRTPLNIILGYTELLRARQFGPLGTTQAETLERIDRSGHELLDLIDATLDLSRLDHGRVPLDCAVVALPPLLSELADETRELLRDKPQVRFSLRRAPALPTLRTDRAKLKVVLKNLLANATKFTDRGRIVLAATPRDGGVELAVGDTGVGIAHEVLPIVFEAFRQLDSSMTRRHGGVGLGLHVVQRLAELLHATVSVTSTPGTGSTFRVWLPLAIAAGA